MCGRYAAAKKPDQLIEEFQVDAAPTEELRPDFNVAPSKKVYAVLSRATAGGHSDGPKRTATESGARGGDVPAGSSWPGAHAVQDSGAHAVQDSGAHAVQDSGADAVQDSGGVVVDESGGADSDPLRRELRVVRWGLIPSWAKDASIGSRLVNARVETLAAKPAFRRAFAVRRCILPADGYYEWYRPIEPAAKRQPFYIHATDGQTLAMAGLYEIWRDPDLPMEHPESLRWTVTVVTTAANADVGRIHERMPLLVQREHWSAWLDPKSDTRADVEPLLAPPPLGFLTAYPVASAVNRVANNGPELIAPLSAEESDAGTLF
jgi:putative SOS response-associated peptidase YedK